MLLQEAHRHGRLATSSKLRDAYADALPASRALVERALRLFPAAVTHDRRRMEPFPLYVDARRRAQVGRGRPRVRGLLVGARALFFGHNPPGVREAVQSRRRARTRAPATRSRSSGASGCTGWFRAPSGSLHRLRHRGHAHGVRLARAFTGKRTS